MANNNERRWSVPSKRAKGYAEERKAKVHQHGPKVGKELHGIFTISEIKKKLEEMKAKQD